MSKLAVLIDLLMKGPVSSITPMREAKYASRASLANAMAEIPGVRRILVDAGCRNIQVYWVEGEIQQKRKLRNMVPEIVRLQTAHPGMTIKQAMRELALDHKPDTVGKALRSYRKKHAA